MDICNSSGKSSILLNAWYKYLDIYPKMNRAQEKHHKQRQLLCFPKGCVCGGLFCETFQPRPSASAATLPFLLKTGDQPLVNQWILGVSNVQTNPTWTIWHNLWGPVIHLEKNHILKKKTSDHRSGLHKLFVQLCVWRLSRFDFNTNLQPSGKSRIQIRF